AIRFGWDYQGEPLSTVFAAAKNSNEAALRELFEERYKNVRPSPALQKIASFPWVRVYTTNVDDAFQNALSAGSPQQVHFTGRCDDIRDKSQLFTDLSFVYLNGTVHRPADGFIFSAEE